jgi:uncharacterized protein (TIGR00369 family)
MMMEEVARYKNCFVCGDQNVNGLKAKFFVRKDGAVISEIVADERFQGYKNVLHGGIISSMLDEVMIKSVLATGIFAVTAEMTVKFRRPVFTGQRISFIGKLAEQKGRIFKAEGTAANDDGVIVASATATFLEAKGELRSVLTDSIE